MRAALAPLAALAASAALAILTTLSTLAKTEEHGFCLFLVERENDLQADFALDTRPIKVSYSAAAGTATGARTCSRD